MYSDSSSEYYFNLMIGCNNYSYIRYYFESVLIRSITIGLQLVWDILLTFSLVIHTVDQEFEVIGCLNRSMIILIVDKKCKAVTEL